MTSKFALVIANTDYQDESLAKLTAPGKDAEEFARVLQQPDLAGFDKVEVLLNESESKTRRVIARFFTERKQDDLLLLYFSGHGVRNDQGQLFLAANDTEINILEATGIPAEFITRSMNNSRSKRQLLILDCCNSGAFDRGAKLSPKMGISEAFEGNGFGRVVLTATDAVQFAWEGDKVIGDTQNSVFTHFLIQGLEGEADRNGDGRITIDELYDYAHDEVVKRTPKQTPSKWSYKQQGDIFLRENLKPREVKPTPLPSDTLDLLASLNPRSRNLGIQDLAEYLDGKNLGWARSAEEKLREIANTDDSLSLRKTASDILANHGLLVEQPAPELIERNKILPDEEAQPEAKKEIPALHVETEKPVTEDSPVEFESSKPAKPKIPVWAMGLFTLVIVSILIWGIYTFTSKITTLGIGSTMISEKDGMTLLYVPAGKFTMGIKAGDALTQCKTVRSDCQLSSFAEEQPPHEVDLSAFWIDQTEVTNAMFAKFIDDTGYQTDAQKQGSAYRFQANSPIEVSGMDWQHPSGPNSDISGREKHPVINISWNDAVAYCDWAGRRLPSEAEWEKAARGTDGRIYPWGNELPNNRLLNYNGNIEDVTTEVGTYPDGKSFYGAYDMAGNVWEWVHDWYDATYYQNSPSSNPLGPDPGSIRVLRGGDWGGDEIYSRSVTRGANVPSNAYYTYGFRCARSP